MVVRCGPRHLVRRDRRTELAGRSANRSESARRDV
jgi:hypothetical protein